MSSYQQDRNLSSYQDRNQSYNGNTYGGSNMNSNYSSQENARPFNPPTLNEYANNSQNVRGFGQYSSGVTSQSTSSWGGQSGSWNSADMTSNGWQNQQSNSYSQQIPRLTGNPLTSSWNRN